jgi:P4 family phage/plasmid primase-like protien
VSTKVHLSSEAEESLSFEETGVLVLEPVLPSDEGGSVQDEPVGPREVRTAEHTFTIWDALKNTTGHRSHKSWADMFASKPFQEPPIVAEKKQIPGWSPALFKDDRRAKGNVEAVTALVLDYDAKLTRITISEAEVAWQDYFGLIHTTWSSREDAHCFRVIIPFSRAVSAEEYPLIWDWANEEAAFFGQQLDPAARDASRLWFLPARRDGRAHYEHRLLRGERMLDPDLVLAAVSREESVGTANERAIGSAAPVEERIERARQYLAKMPPAIEGQNGSRAAFKAALAMVRGFALESEDALRLLAEQYNPRCLPPWTDAELRHKVEDAERSTIPLGFLFSPQAPGRGRAFFRGDEVEIAERYAARIEPNAVYTDGHTYVFGSCVWEAVPVNQQLHNIAAFAGAPVADGKTVRPLRLSARGCKGVLELAQARLAKPGFFDDAKRGLAFANGFVTLEGNRAVQCDASPEHRARFAYAFAYTRDPSIPMWTSFLESLWEGDDDRAEKVAALQEFVGASLFGLAPRMKRCLMLFGESNSGKSTLLDVVRALFPDGATTAVGLHEMEHEYRRAMLAGALLNTVAEVSSKELLQSEAFKAIVAGDVIQARPIYGQPFEFRPRAGHIFAANTLPRVADRSEAVWNRMLILTFNRCFSTEPDPLRGQAPAREGLAEAIINQERPGIIAWAIQGLERLASNRWRYTVPASSTRELALWRHDSDPLEHFVDDEIVIDASRKCRSAHLYAHYSTWCLSNGITMKLTHPNFTKHLKRVVARRTGSAPRTTTVKGYLVLHGLGLRQVDSGLRDVGYDDVVN